MICAAGIDLWMMGCTVFISSTLLEFAYICNLCNHNEMITGGAEIRMKIKKIDKYARAIYQHCLPFFRTRLGARGVVQDCFYKNNMRFMSVCVFVSVCVSMCVSRCVTLFSAKNKISLTSLSR